MKVLEQLPLYTSRWPTSVARMLRLWSLNRKKNHLGGGDQEVGAVGTSSFFQNGDGPVERGQPGYDGLFRVHPIIDFKFNVFQPAMVYGPLMELRHEMTVAFKGRTTRKVERKKRHLVLSQSSAHTEDFIQ